MQKFLEKITISVVGLSIMLNPLVVLLPQTVKAASNDDLINKVDPTDDDPTGFDPSSVDPATDLDNDPNFDDGKPLSNVEDLNVLDNADFPGYLNIIIGEGTATQSFNDLANLYYKYAGSGNLSFSDIFTDTNNPPIVMNTADRNAVKALMCLSQIIPNYAEDYTALYLDLPKNEQEAVERENPPEHNTAAIDATVARERASATPRFTTSEQYFNFLKSGSANQDPTERIANYNLMTSLIEEAEKSYTNDRLREQWASVVAKILKGEDHGVDVSTLTCITAGNVTDINTQERRI